MKCVSVEYIDDSFDLCDLEIDGGDNNYVAEGIVVHNTWCAIGCVPELNHPELDEGKFVVSSKGLSGQGLAFKNNEGNDGNVYLRMFKTVKEKIQLLSDWIATNDYSENGTVYVLGEVFGPIQDLRYGFNDPQFRVFDIYVRLPGIGRYLPMNDVINICKMFGFTHVPVLYRGPFSIEVMKEFTDGKETVSGKEQHIREGIVMNVIPERYSPELHSRLVLKSVSEDYLTRKNKNATEYN
jgi:RNA ligase (TIGR02306 family)